MAAFDKYEWCARCKGKCSSSEPCVIVLPCHLCGTVNSQPATEISCARLQEAERKPKLGILKTTQNCAKQMQADLTQEDHPEKGKDDFDPERNAAVVFGSEVQIKSYMTHNMGDEDDITSKPSAEACPTSCLPCITNTSICPGQCIIHHQTEPMSISQETLINQQKSDDTDVFKVPIAVRKEMQSSKLIKQHSEDLQCRTPPPWIRKSQMSKMSTRNLHKKKSIQSPRKTSLKTSDFSAKTIPKTPNVPWTPLLRTPNVSLTPFLTAYNLASTPLLKLHNMALTPLLTTPCRPPQNLGDLTGPVPLADLSTPALFQATNPSSGQMDLLTLIDDDNVECDVVERKVGNYNENLELLDSIVPDYIMDIVDDYKQNKCSSKTSQQDVHVKVTEAKVYNQSNQIKKGQFCKRMPEDVKEMIKSEQLKNNKAKKKRKKPRLIETTEDCIKRRVNSGRRTRSLVKLAQDCGLDINSYEVRSNSTEE